MNNNLIELVFILDRSGSMANLVEDTLGGFNAMLRRQKEQQGQALVSTVVFHQVSQVIHDRVPLEQVQELTRQDYVVGGCTALLDAVGDAVTHIRNVHKYAREEDRPARTLVVITTDGYENASRSYTYERLKALIEQQKERGWEFIFMGANIDAAKEAARFGISRDCAVDYHADSKGTGAVYEAVDEAVCQVRKCAPMGKGWRKKADADFACRRKKD